MRRQAGIAKAFAIAAALIATASIAQAQEKPPCDQFAWPLDQERAWFQGSHETISSGKSFEKLGDGAFIVELAPADAVAYVMSPESPPKQGQPNGAILTFGGVAQSGSYQVTLSDEAWIDMVQNNAYRPSTGHTGVHGCQGLRKSVRFDLEQGPLAIQISGATSAKIGLAVRHLD
jgi:hypothetical protein